MKFIRELLSEASSYTYKFTWFDLEQNLEGNEDGGHEMWDQIAHAIEEKYPGTFPHDTLRYRHSSGPDLDALAYEYVKDIYDKEGMKGVRELLSDMHLLEHVTKIQNSERG